MKNTSEKDEWRQFIGLITYKCTILNLQSKTFATKSSEINMCNIWFHVKQKSPSYYQNLNVVKSTFLHISNKQKFTDSFFNFFPIVYFKNSMFNASIDAIDPSLEQEERHNPDNIQIIPKYLNYGKNTLSNESFLQEWNKRKFRTDYSECSVVLPDMYEFSYFNLFLK
jgi:hypothetical protein